MAISTQNNSEIRDGIFSLRTRRFGTVAEIMIKKMINLNWGESISHDLIDPANSDRIEVKFSTALKSNKETINGYNVLNQIYAATNSNRMFSQSEWNNFGFDCNIQQVKMHEFEVLFYGIFFSDVIEIFKITPSQIKTSTGLNYSDKQHAGNIGEGQFHLNNNTYAYHKNNFFYKSINYTELQQILTS